MSGPDDAVKDELITTGLVGGNDEAGYEDDQRPPPAAGFALLPPGHVDNTLLAVYFIFTIIWVTVVSVCVIIMTQVTAPVPTNASWVKADGVMMLLLAFGGISTFIVLYMLDSYSQPAPEKRNSGGGVERQILSILLVFFIVTSVVVAVYFAIVFSGHACQSRYYCHEVGSAKVFMLVVIGVAVMNVMLFALLWMMKTGTVPRASHTTGLVLGIFLTLCLLASLGDIIVITTLPRPLPELLSWPGVSFVVFVASTILLSVVLLADYSRRVVEPFPVIKTCSYLYLGFAVIATLIHVVVYFVWMYASDTPDEDDTGPDRYDYLCWNETWCGSFETRTVGEGYVLQSVHSSGFQLHGIFLMLIIALATISACIVVCGPAAAGWPRRPRGGDSYVD